MALFQKKVCVRCGKECGMFGRTTTKDDKVLCTECAKLAGKEFESYEHTYDQYLALVDRYNENEKKLQEFHIDKVYYGRIFIDTQKNWIAFTDSSVLKKDSMYKKHPHVYDAKDLRLCHMTNTIKDTQTTIVGTEVKLDVSVIVSFEDEFVPCPLNDVVVLDREVKVKGVFKKKMENGGVTEEDAEFMAYMTDALLKNGIKIPSEIQKGEENTLDDYALFFTALFDLEKRNIIKHKQTESILENFAPSISMQLKIREHFTAK